MRRANFATILVVLAQAALVYGCSSAETPAGDDSATGGTGGAGATGGAGGATGGAGGTTGGTGGATGGTGGTATGGSGGGVIPPECKGISTGKACTPEGQACPNLVCGLGDSGSRSCDCMTNWVCSSCDWTNSPYAWARSKPADITPCTGSEQDGSACTTVDATCEGASNGEACVCFLDDEGALIWDCDRPPGTWAAAAN
jgi:hypothetical protein